MAPEFWSEEVPPVIKPSNRAPEGGVRRSKYDVVVRKLRMNRKRRGMWAKVATDVHYTITSRLRRRYPDIQWTVRQNDRGKHDLWASYQPENLIIETNDKVPPVTNPMNFS